MTIYYRNQCVILLCLVSDNKGYLLTYDVKEALEGNHFPYEGEAILKPHMRLHYMSIDFELL